MPQIKVEIGGRSYRMACEDGEEQSLRDLAAQVDARIEELRAGIGEVGDTRLAVMAAIVLADERNEAERRAAGAELGQSGEASESEALARRLAEMEEKAAAALDAAAQTHRPPDAPPGRARRGGEPGARRTNRPHGTFHSGVTISFDDRPRQPYLASRRAVVLVQKFIFPGPYDSTGAVPEPGRGLVHMAPTYAVGSRDR